MIDIIIPTLGRPHRIAEIVDNIHAATNHDHRVIIVVERHDPDSAAAASKTAATVVVNHRTHNYQGAVNSGYEASTADWVFCGADDLIFHYGWDDECMALDDGFVGVIGTNDLYNPHVLAGMHSTHSLVRRAYLNEMGGVPDLGPGSFLAECYDHNFCDTEFIATAKMRARFRPCLTAIVEHMHPCAGKAEVDDTYQRSMAEFDRDARLYDMRTSLWAGLVR